VLWFKAGEGDAHLPPLMECQINKANTEDICAKCLEHLNERNSRDTSFISMTGWNFDMLNW